MKRIAPLSFAMLVLLAAPLSVFAHEHRTFEAGGKTYSFTIGSIGEPVFVDDKSGVEIMVEEAVPAMAHDDHEEGDEHTAGTPAVGLETTLKVEVIAGDKKQTFDLKPAYGEPGSYRAPFYPTVQTTYAYRVFGTLNAAPFDVTFTCNPAGHPATPEDTSPVKVSDGVTQTLKSGAFGCPQARDVVQFPEQGKTLVELSSGGSGVAMVALAVAVLGLIVGLAAWMKAAKRV